MPPKFIYFDLGNVILRFDHGIACRQMAEVAGVTEETVMQFFSNSDLQRRFEHGQLSPEEYCQQFASGTRTDPDRDSLLQACSAMFELNTPIVPVVAQLRAAGHRLGILSNTCLPHWEYVSQGRYKLVEKYFDVHVLSYEVGSMKPDAKIYNVAIEAAGVAPNEILFTDDRLENVEGALRAGIDAIHFTSPRQLLIDLRKRDIEFNI